MQANHIERLEIFFFLEKTKKLEFFGKLFETMN